MKLSYDENDGKCEAKILLLIVVLNFDCCNHIVDKAGPRHEHVNGSFFSLCASDCDVSLRDRTILEVWVALRMMSVILQQLVGVAVSCTFAVDSGKDEE